MSEAHLPRGETADSVRFAYEFNADLESDLEESVSRLGISASQVILNAAEFQIYREAMRAENMMLEARASNGIEVHSMSEMATRYDRPETSSERKRVHVAFTPEEMQTIMLLASYGYSEEVGENAEGFNTWDEQRNTIGVTTANALRSYFVRLQAEHDGWQFYLNPNMGEGMHKYLDVHTPKQGGDDAETR